MDQANPGLRPGGRVYCGLGAPFRILPESRGTQTQPIVEEWATLRETARTEMPSVAKTAKDASYISVAALREEKWPNTRFKASVVRPRVERTPRDGGQEISSSSLGLVPSIHPQGISQAIPLS